MPQPEHPPIDRLADYYPPRPGYCASTSPPHTAAETFVVSELGYFTADRRICHVHLLAKCHMAVWPLPWQGRRPVKDESTRPLPLEMSEWPHVKTKPDDGSK